MVGSPLVRVRGLLNGLVDLGAARISIVAFKFSGVTPLVYFRARTRHMSDRRTILNASGIGGGGEYVDDYVDDIFMRK